MTATTGHQVAIVGMAALMPSAGTLEQYWRNLVDGVDAISDVPPHRWDPAFYEPDEAHRPDRLYCRRGGFVDDLATFDPLRFGIMPASVGDVEPDQLIALKVAAAAIDDAGGPERMPAGDRVGVILGRGGTLSPAQARYATRVRVPTQLVQVLREVLPDVDPDRIDLVRRRFEERLGRHQPEGTIGIVPNLAASRIANRLNLRGPAYTVDGACASSLLAVDQAIAELNGGRLDAVLAGGVHHTHDISFWSVFSQLGALSRRGEIRPFDAGADGLLIGEGTGIVVLKRLADAARDGDRVYAVIRGSGTSSDGRAASMFNPATAGQVLAIRRAWAAAGLDPTAPDALGLLEAHGTATPTGDAAELTTVAEVFGPHRGDARPVIGSVKSMIGHTMPAAGAAGLIKAALAVHHGVLLPTLHCDAPRPELAQTRFAPIPSAQPWESDGPRRAGVNAFGFGGINAHLVLEQAPDTVDAYTAGPGVPTRAVAVDQPDEVLWLAAPDPAALARLLDGDGAAVRAAGIAGNGAAGTAGGCRLGVVGPDERRLAVARRAVAAGAPWRGARDVWFSPRPLLAGPAAGRLAFVFPGLETEFEPRTRDVAARFRLADRDWTAMDLGRHGAGVIEVGKLLDQALGHLGVRPDAVAGYSLGEWAAAATTGQVSASSMDEFLTLFDAASVEVSGYAFAVAGAPAQRITPLLDEYPGVVLSHDNTPSQCVVNGPESEVDRLVQALRARNVLCQKLPFRSAFHTPRFATGLRAIGDALRRSEVRPPRVPVWSATVAAPFPTEPERVQELFVRHMLEPVRFRALVTAMYDAGVRVFLQVGTGQLASLIGDNLRGRDHLAMPVNVPHRAGLNQLRRVATALWVEGGTPDLAALDPAPATARPARKGPVVKLDLGGSLVSLGDGAGDLLGHDSPPVPAAPRRPEPVPGAALSTLDRLAGQSSAAAELAALLRDTAGSAVTVLQAAARPPAAPVRPAPRPPAPPQPYRTVLRASLETMPYLRDHCFFVQPEDWPDMADRWPVVPATTVVQHMMDAAERAAPGQRAVAVRDARFNRWIIAAPPQDIAITVTPAGPGRMSVQFGPYARATVEVAPEYPADRPEPWRHDPATERPTPVSAAEMYADRLMFHGPLFQAVTTVHALGERHARGLLTTPTPPGALLDNALQLIGNWLVATQPSRTVALPVGLGHVRFFGPAPAAGTPVECVARVGSIDDTQIVAAAQLMVGGRVWAQIDGVLDRRFDSHHTAKPAERFPERHPMSLRQPEGWAMAFDCWTDLVTQGMAARAVLGNTRYADYERQPPGQRKGWLLGRIAAKDAVRFRLWEDGHENVYPIELTVTNDPDGRPRLLTSPMRDYRACDVSLAHTGEIGVAIAKAREPATPDDAPGVGIDVAEIIERPPSTVDFALSERERALLSSLGGDATEWFARFWTAKEAAGKAEGTGLAGNPRRLAVVAATPDVLTVEVSGRTYRVGHRIVHNPDDLPPRRYAVGWTWGPLPTGGA
ncbi:beta-ketoacyl synthase N-terminal-like domain-containing protein [Phytohabitans sp. ZYX-F-186]|uniref:Beta-ketoacyl synthase N-terminal-like domain-containing protein n=1 Tax=Phytohabitans maris TaxID=3071409 RepID=A0ABU0ZTN1_9ACTN|nr:beta-ketoacyl synthase N-terminal-like domain-containing protein [Phytohabitans sp. ZYX-F-186]MDQ7910391.1 beta-ketoacyl synthase N-terminal-like domain-containing protein [Phytohabitans sp. ZYX-F-186]